MRITERSKREIAGFNSRGVLVGNAREVASTGEWLVFFVGSGLAEWRVKNLEQAEKALRDCGARTIRESFTRRF